MFDIGWGELVVIGVVALIAIGPKELPGVLRMVGQWMGKIRRMASEFQGQFQEAMREAEFADLKKEIDETSRNLTSSFDPIADLHKDVESALAANPETAAQNASASADVKSDAGEPKPENTAATTVADTEIAAAPGEAPKAPDAATPGARA